MAMTDKEQLARAMVILDVAVQNMAIQSIGPIVRAVALASYMQAQVDLVMPNKAAADAFKRSLAT